MNNATIIRDAQGRSRNIASRRPITAAYGRLRPETTLVEDLLGFSYWPLPRLGLTALWLPAWSSTGETGAFDDRLRLTLAARF